MQLKVIFWTWYMNKSCTLRILDSFHMVRSTIAMNNIFVLNLKSKIQNYFVIQLRIKYWLL